MNPSDKSNTELLKVLFSRTSQKTRREYLAILHSRPSRELFFNSSLLIQSKNSKKRVLGVDIISQLGITKRPFVKETLSLLFTLLAHEKNTDVIASVLYAIGHNNKKLAPSQIEKICTLAQASNTEIKEAVIFALLGLTSAKALQTLILLSGDKLSRIRNWATFALASQTDRDSKAIRESLWARTKDRHQETRLEAILGLAQRQDKRVKELIVKELGRKNSGTLLFDAIIESGDKSFLPLLQQNLKKISHDKQISKEWRDGLKQCILMLKKFDT